DCRISPTQFPDVKKWRPIDVLTKIDNRRLNFTGVREVQPSIVDLREYIDWSPFFHVWELRGRYPAIFDDPTVGKQARELFDDTKKILDEIAAKKLLTARGVFGFWPARANGDDVDLSKAGARFCL